MLLVGKFLAYFSSDLLFLPYLCWCTQNTHIMSYLHHQSCLALGTVISTTKNKPIFLLCAVGRKTYFTKQILSSNFLVDDDSGDLSSALWAALTQILVQKIQFSLLLDLWFVNILCHLQELSHFQLQRNAARNRLLAQLSLVETFVQKSAAMQPPQSIVNKQTQKR